MRKVSRAVSKTTAMWVAELRARNWDSIWVKPKTAFTGVPSGRVIGGRAWKARKMKPDPSIFALACERFGFAPGDFLFVDDSARNIDGARALGFDAHYGTIVPGTLARLLAQLVATQGVRRMDADADDVAGADAVAVKRLDRLVDDRGISSELQKRPEHQVLPMKCSRIQCRSSSDPRFVDSCT